MMPYTKPERDPLDNSNLEGVALGETIVVAVIIVLAVGALALCLALGVVGGVPW
jgi:hypothetical protein